jgi:hypothetical protein
MEVEAQQRGGGAPAFMAFLMIVGLLIIALSSHESPASTPVPASGYFACEPGIAIGTSARTVYDNVRMRQSPGYAGKNDAADTIHYLKAGDIVRVLDGPVITDGLCWWFGEHTGIRGWSADHSRQGRRLLSPAP